MEKRIIYADNAATTRVSESVLNAMLPVFTEQYGNPSSVHTLGREAARLIMRAAEQTADALGASPGEIYFTSGGTESDNWAIRSAAALGERQDKKHIITSMTEHHAVLRCCEGLERQGFEVTYLRPDEFGRVTAEQVSGAIRGDTCLVSVMTANNEVGTIQPIAEIGRLCRERGVIFHTDAVQAAGNIPLDVKELCADMLSVSGHKIHSPKGVGALYIRKGTEILPMILGGSQQRGKRAGTENTAGIVGLGQAMEDITRDIPGRVQRLTAMRDRLIKGLLTIPETRLNGHPTERLCGNVSISVRGVEGESLLLMLETMGICASSGAACASGSLEPSHVLTAMGLPGELARGSLRLSLGDDNSPGEIDCIIAGVTEAVSRIREHSPLWASYCSGNGSTENM